MRQHMSAHGSQPAGLMQGIQQLQRIPVDVNVAQSPAVIVRIVNPAGMRQQAPHENT